MAKRFHSITFYTQSNVQYDIEIWDTAFASTSTEFYTSAEGFELSYQSEARKKKPTIITSDCTFRFYVNSATHEALADDLTTAEEGRFQVKIFKDSNFWWCGEIVTDNTIYPDLDKHFLTIQATDGLGQLSNLDYNNDGTAYTGEATLLEHVHNALSKTDLLNFGWGASDVCITTVDNWYEDSHSTGATNDPLALTRVKHRAFYEVDNKGKSKFISALDVIQNIVQSRNSYLILSAGAWRIVQYPEMVNATVIERRYDRDGAYLSNDATANYTKTLDQDASTAAKENIVDFGWLPALREVVITYRAKNWVNYLAGYQWTSSSSDVVTTNEEIDHNQGQTSLRVQFLMSQSLENVAYTDNENVALFYRLQIKVGTKYLRRNINSSNNFNITYQTPGWVTGQSYYYFHYEIPASHIPSVGSTQPVSPGAFDIITPQLQETGQAEVQVTFYAIRKMATGVGVSTGDLTPTWSTSGALLQVISSGDPVLDVADVEYKVTNDNGTANSEKLEILTYIGDGNKPNTMGRLEVYNGSTWSNASGAGSAAGWQVGGAGTKYFFWDLLARSIMAGQKTPTKILSGDIWDTGGTYQPHHRIDDNSSDAIWCLMGATYSAQNERWTGDWFYIADSPTDITSTDPVPVDPGPPNTGPGGNVPVGPVVVPNSGYNGGPIAGPVSPGDQTGGGLTGLGGILGGTFTNLNLPTGGVTTIGTTNTLNQGAYNTGDVITVIDPTTGTQYNFTVTADVQAGDTSISVTGYAADDIPAGSYIVTSPQNGIVQGYGSNTSGSTSAAQTSKWWDIFQQWWEEDDANDIDWPIEGENIAIETDPDAGDGATAGFRIDGDGLTSYSNSSATPGVKIGLSGKLELNNLDTGTTTDVLNVESSGEVRKVTLSTGVTDHGALTGLGDDDHTQYHNDTRGDARYYTQTQLDSGQLDNQYYQESEHINSSAGAGDAGKPIKLDAGGKIDASMIEASDIDHGALSGLGDDDHTQYTKNTGRSGGQTIQGGTDASDDLTLESTTNVTKGSIILSDDVVGSAGFDFRSDQNAGDGATAGVTIKNTDGINVYNSSSATARAAFLQTGAWEVRTVSAATNGIVIGSGSGINLYESSSVVASMTHTGRFTLGWSSLPTVYANGFVVLGSNGVIHTDTDGAAGGWQPNYGHIKKFDVLNWSTNWSTGVVNGPFWGITSEYAGYEVWAVGFSCGNSKGTGAGSNSCVIKHTDGTTTTTLQTATINPGGNTSNKFTTMTNYPTLAAHDRIYFEVTSVSATTPAQGLIIELYLRKA